MVLGLCLDVAGREPTCIANGVTHVGFFPFHVDLSY